MKNLPDSWWNLAIEVVVKCSNEKSLKHGSKPLRPVACQRKPSRSKLLFKILFLTHYCLSDSANHGVYYIILVVKYISLSCICLQSQKSNSAALKFNLTNFSNNRCDISLHNKTLLMVILGFLSLVSINSVSLNLSYFVNNMDISF